MQDNLHALSWGRLAAYDETRLAQIIARETGDAVPEIAVPKGADELIAHRVRHLTNYQDARYAARFRDFVEQVRAAEKAAVPGSTALTEAVAWSLSRLMSYKDEYEVARLYTNGDFLRRLRQQFDGNYRLNFHLSPPVLNPTDKATGKPRKLSFGPWMMPAFRLLGRLKGLRGTPFDVFGYNPERRLERQLIVDYRRTITDLLPVLNAENLSLVVSIAALADTIRGYGHVKAENLRKYRLELERLLASFDTRKVAKAA